MSSDIKIEIPESLRSDLQTFANRIAKNIATTVRDSITTEYAIAVEEFYNSYTPSQYVRKWQLRNSFKPYYRNPHGTRYHGGVEISTDNMDNVHHDSNDYVLSCALSGYHGRPSLGIFTPPWIYEHVENYRNILFSYIDVIAEDAIKKAKNESYSMLRFR